MTIDFVHYTTYLCVNNLHPQIQNSKTISASNRVQDRYGNQLAMSAPYINSSDDTSDSGHINNDMIGICEDLSKLLKDHKYHEILTIIPTLSKFEYLPSSARLIISLTLLKLGRRLPALREIALSIESCMDRQEKENLIKYLINMFKDLGLYDRAEIAYNEAIELAKIELKLCGLNEERKNKILNRITAYKNELKLCATKYENSNDNQ